MKSKKNSTKILIGFIIGLILIQFIPMKKNLSNDQTQNIANAYPIPESTNEIMKVACYDCHSNYTRYPSYSKIQPIGFLLNYDIQKGKKHLNFSTMLSLPVSVQYHKLEEIVENVEEGEMPLPLYTLFGLHPEAKLTTSQRADIVNWANDARDKMKQAYPPDSLEMKRRR